MQNLTAILKASFNNQIDIVPQKENLLQLFVPIFYPDGDMVDIFIRTDSHDANMIEICDCGLTLMRLSYTFDINSPTRERLLLSIISQAGATLDENGSIRLKSPINDILSSSMKFSQIITEVSNMKILHQSNINNMFYENVKKYIIGSLSQYNPICDAVPWARHDEFSVDYILSKNEKNIYLFPIQGPAKAKNVAITILSLQKQATPFTSVLVHDNFDKLPRKDKKITMGVADKQFFDCDAFIESAPDYLARVMN